MYIQSCIFVGPKCRPGSTGQAYIGVNNKILDPDENGFGEVAVSSRNVFMGYHKDPIRTEESFQGQKDTRTPRPLETLVLVHLDPLRIPVLTYTSTPNTKA